MDKFTEIISKISEILWGPWLMIALIGMGVYFTIGTKFLQFRRMGFVFKQTIGRMFQKESEIEGEGTLTPFQSGMTAIAATVGVGNIVGVATALYFGGPGAIFWMWVSAVFGMCTKYAEIVLSIAYREQNEKGEFIGGPPLYMKKGLNSTLLATLFTLALTFGCIGGNMVQANSISGTITYIFNASPKVVGIVLTILVAVVAFGGIQRLGKVTEKLVPTMALIYIIGGTIVILFNLSDVPSAFAMIFKGAFSPIAVGGGTGGFAVSQAIRFGIARGLYSNEAGQGTAPIAHATAKTDHPSRQGLWGILEVFVVTCVICTITALAILTTGVLESGESPVVLTSLAFGTITPALKYVVSISLILFAYSTIITLCYYGESLSTVIGGEKLGKVYKCLFIPFTFIGAIGGLKVIWSIIDVLMAIGIIPNMIAILLLSPKVFRLTNEFFWSKEK